jgi:hypothetical protein
MERQKGHLLNIILSYVQIVSIFQIFPSALFCVDLLRRSIGPGPHDSPFPHSFANRNAFNSIQFNSIQFYLRSVNPITG